MSSLLVSPGRLCQKETSMSSYWGLGQKGRLEVLYAGALLKQLARLRKHIHHRVLSLVELIKCACLAVVTQQLVQLGHSVRLLAEQLQIFSIGRYLIL